MAVTTVGDFEFNLNHLSDITNNSLEIGSQTTLGVAEMSPILGIGIGIGAAGTAIAFGLVALLSIVFIILSKVKGFGKAIK